MFIVVVKIALLSLHCYIPYFPISNYIENIGLWRLSWYLMIDNTFIFTCRTKEKQHKEWIHSVKAKIELWSIIILHWSLKRSLVVIFTLYCFPVVANKMSQNVVLNVVFDWPQTYFIVCSLRVYDFTCCSSIIEK